MKTFRITEILADDVERTIEYPCQTWEVSVMLINCTWLTLRGIVEFKSYDKYGAQILRRHDFTKFEIINS